MTAPDPHSFKLGQHDAQIEALEVRMASIEKKLDEALGILNQARGGWRTLVAVGGLASVASSAVTWFLTHFTSK